MKARGTRPRLSVFRSGKHIYAQIIDDGHGSTVVSVSDTALPKQEERRTKTETAAAVGVLLAARAVKENIRQVMFDRGAYKFHGRIKALADAARKGGLQF